MAGIIELPAALISISAVLSKAVKYGDKVIGASEEIEVARELVETISSTVSEVRSAQTQLAKTLSREHHARVNATIDRTTKFLDLVNEVVKAPSETANELPSKRQQLGQVFKASARSFLWAFRDGKRVVSYGLVLLFLHASLLDMGRELRELRQSANIPPPAYTEIYSDQSRAEILEIVKSWNEVEGIEDAEREPAKDFALSATRDFQKFRQYSERSRNAITAEIVRQKVERASAKSWASEPSIKHRSSMAEEAKKRRIERTRSVPI